MKVLQSEGSEVGMIGLMQFLDAEDPPAPIQTPTRPSIGESILVIPTTNMRDLVQRLKDGGHTLISEPGAWRCRTGHPATNSAAAILTEPWST